MRPPQRRQVATVAAIARSSDNPDSITSPPIGYRPFIRIFAVPLTGTLTTQSFVLASFRDSTRPMTTNMRIGTIVELKISNHDMAPSLQLLLPSLLASPPEGVAWNSPR